MNSHIEIYIHFVWATWNREALILPEWERALWSQLRNEVVAQNCRLLALGGTENHIYLLAHLHSTVVVAEFVQRVKGSSSQWVNDQVSPMAHLQVAGILRRVLGEPWRCASSDGLHQEPEATPRGRHDRRRLRKNLSSRPKKLAPIFSAQAESGP